MKRLYANSIAKLVFLLVVSAFGVKYLVLDTSMIKKKLADTDIPVAAAQKLFTIFSIDHDGSLEDIVAKTQKAWLRQSGTERWEIAKSFEDKRDLALPVLQDLGVVFTVEPSQKKYDYAIILGALISRVRSRFAYLSELWKQGIRFETVVFLTGQRDLDAQFESKEILLNASNNELPFRSAWEMQGVLPENEYEMAKMVFDQLDIPEDMRQQVKVIFVDTPKQKTISGTMRRPNTGDTVEQWLKSDPQLGSCLAISNQPYVGYQHAVLKTFLPNQFEVETVGLAASDNLSIAIYLDNVARWLYQELKRLETRGEIK